MKRTIRVFAFLMALFMIICLSLVGCGGDKTAGTDKTAENKAGKKVTIRYGLWGSEEEQKIQKEAAERIGEVYPEITLEVTPYPDSATFWQKLPAEVAAKTAPDIIQLSNEGHLEYIVKGAFAPIDNEIKEAGIDMDRYVDSAKAIWAYEGKQYGIPMGACPEMFIINKDMWDEAGLGEYPKTMDELKTAAKALTKDGTAGLIINIMEFHLTQYALAFGGGWGNGKTVNSAENIKAMEFVVDMFKENLAVTPKQTGHGWDGEVFANKKGAMSTGGYWYKGFLVNAAPDINYVAVPIPMGADKPACAMHSAGIVVLKDSVDKVAAVKAAAYLADEPVLTKLMDSVGLNPALESLAPKYYEANPEFKAIEAVVPYCQDFGYPAEDSKRFIDSLVEAMESKILKNDNKSVKDILDELQAKNFK
jgi:multiple sugar transport system substrate-binding protein